MSVPSAPNSFASAANAAFPFFGSPPGASNTPSQPVNPGQPQVGIVSENIDPERIEILERFPQLKAPGDFRPIGNGLLHLLGQAFAVRFHKLPDARPRGRTSSGDMISQLISQHQHLGQRARNESNISMHSDGSVDISHHFIDFVITEMPSSGIVLEFYEDRPNKLYWLPPDNLSLKLASQIEPYECKGTLCLLADSDMRIGHTYHPGGSESPTVPHFELIHVKCWISELDNATWHFLKAVLSGEGDGDGAGGDGRRQSSGTGGRPRLDVSYDQGDQDTWLPAPEALFPQSQSSIAMNAQRSGKMNFSTPPRFPTNVNPSITGEPALHPHPHNQSHFHHAHHTHQPPQQQQPVIPVTGAEGDIFDMNVAAVEVVEQVQHMSMDDYEPDPETHSSLPKSIGIGMAGFSGFGSGTRTGSVPSIPLVPHSLDTPVVTVSGSLPWAMGPTIDSQSSHALAHSQPTHTTRFLPTENDVPTASASVSSRSMRQAKSRSKGGASGVGAAVKSAPAAAASSAVATDEPPRSYSKEYSERRCQNANCPNGPDFIEPYGYRPGPEGRGTLCGTCARKFRKGKLTDYVSRRELAVSIAAEQGASVGMEDLEHVAGTGKLALPVGDRMVRKHGKKGATEVEVEMDADVDMMDEE